MHICMHDVPYFIKRVLSLSAISKFADRFIFMQAV